MVMLCMIVNRNIYCIPRIGKILFQQELHSFERDMWLKRSQVSILFNRLCTTFFLVGDNSQKQVLMIN